ncbi:MAG: hypothetical protein ACJ8CB_08620 [Ktedonobacteraceae bacterium]
MDMLEILSTDEPLYETTTEQTPVRMELLPAWKQLIVESRQLQTVAELLMVASRRQISTSKQHMTLLSQLRKRLPDTCPGC